MESYAFVLTYHVGTTGDVPITEVLVKGLGAAKHTVLTRENNRKRIGKRTCSLKSHTSVMDWIKSYNFIITYKLDTAGDVPTSYVLIKDFVFIKHSSLAGKLWKAGFCLRGFYTSKPHSSDGVTLHPTWKQSQESTY
jgi:hypothetical protein